MAGLASRLATRGHCVTLITLDDGSNDRHDVDDQVIRCRLDVLGVVPSHAGHVVGRIGKAIRRIRTLRDAIDRSAPDVVLSFCDQTNVLTLLATRSLNIPVVVSERSDPSHQKLGLVWEPLRKRTYRNAESIIAQTDSSADYLRTFIGRPAIVIPSAVDVPPLQSDRTTATSNRLIVGVGRLEQEKGFDRLIDAFSELTKQSAAIRQHWRLRVIGEGSLRDQLEQQVGNLGLSDRVTMPGWIRPVWQELAEATLFVLPSRYEGFPSALLEAMALGVPSIAVDCDSGPGAILQDNVNGLLVQNDLAGLTTGMQRMVAEEELRERLGEAGKQIVHQFGWDAMVDAYDQVLAEAVERRARRSK